MMFSGQKQYSIDEKGRVVLPSKHRDALSGDLMVFKDLTLKCLNVYPYDEYEKIVKEFYSDVIVDKDTKILMDRMVGRAEAVQLDKQGRIMIPQWMRDSVGIDKEVLVVGQNVKFEIWTQKAYDTAFNDEEAIAAFDRFEKKREELKLRGLK